VTKAFDAAEIVATVEAIRLEHPAAAKLIEDLWAEVSRLSAHDYVSPARQLTEADAYGPFLAEPWIDVEFFDTQGNACGSDSAMLEIRLNEHGILIISDRQVGFTAQTAVTLGGYRVWVGEEMRQVSIPARNIVAGVWYGIELNLPIRIGQDIGHSDDGSNRGPPRPIRPTRDARVG
jgi:hypothetical protein